MPSPISFERHRSLAFSFLNTKKIFHFPLDSTVRKTLREYYKQFYKFDNLDKMEQFFDNLKLPEITQDEIHDLNRPVIIEKIEFVV